VVVVDNEFINDFKSKADVCDSLLGMVRWDPAEVMAMLLGGR
jgi:hypothetical protein